MRLQNQVPGQSTEQNIVISGSKSPVNMNAQNQSTNQNQGGVPTLANSASTNAITSKIKFLSRAGTGKDVTPVGGQAPRIKVAGLRQNQLQMKNSKVLGQGQASNNLGGITARTKAQIQINGGKNNLAQSTVKLQIKQSKEDLGPSVAPTFGIDDNPKENSRQNINQMMVHKRTGSHALMQQSQFRQKVIPEQISQPALVNNFLVEREANGNFVAQEPFNNVVHESNFGQIQHIQGVSMNPENVVDTQNSPEHPDTLEVDNQ